MKKKMTRYDDLWLAALFVLVGIIVWNDALRLSENAINRISGPDIWLKIVGTLLIILSVMLLVTSIYQKKSGSTEEEERKDPIGKETVTAMIMTGIYAFVLLEYLGFVVATIVYLTIMPIFFRGRAKGFWKALAYYLSMGAAFSFFFWYIFYKLLNVQLPAGVVMSFFG